MICYNELSSIILDSQLFGSVKIEGALGTAFLVRRLVQEGRFLFLW